MSVYSFLKRLCTDSQRSKNNSIPEMIDKDCVDYILTNCLEDECIICLNILEKDDNATLIKCGHVYHSQCIYTWFLKKQVCPICDIGISIK